MKKLKEIATSITVNETNITLRSIKLNVSLVLREIIDNEIFIPLLRNRLAIKNIIEKLNYSPKDWYQ